MNDKCDICKNKSDNLEFVKIDGVWKHVCKNCVKSESTKQNVVRGEFLSEYDRPQFGNRVIL